MDLDVTTVLLIHGYIRNIQQLIANQIIPSSIIELCTKFYQRMLRIMAIQKYP